MLPGDSSSHVENQRYFPCASGHPSCGGVRAACTPSCRANDERAARDTISKCSIGLKEIREAHGRLRLHEACNVGPVDEATKLRIEANELVSIVTTIVGNTRANAGLKPIRRKVSTSYFKTIPNSTPNSIPNS